MPMGPARRRRLSAPLAALAAVVLAFGTACAGADSAGPTVADESRPVDRTATLTVAQFSAPTGFDPVRGRPTGDPSYLTLVYDQLLVLDQDLKVAPGLASAWTTSPDGRELTLDLRSDVRFQDGSPLDSGVVKANLERARVLPQSVAALLLSIVSAIEPEGPNRVRLRFSTPSQNFVYTLASNPSLGAMISGRAIAEGADLTRQPAGSGPYRLMDFGQDRASFVRDDAYWNSPALPAVAAVTIIGIPDDGARFAALQSGQVDLAAVNPQRASDYRDQVSAGTLRETRFPGQVFTLFLNVKSPELADARVRKALSLAVDRSAINVAVFAGAATPTGQMFPAGVAGHLASAEATLYDPDGARTLLAQAGVRNLTLDIVLTSTEPGDTLATILQDQLNKVGVTLNLERFQPTSASPAWYKGDKDGIMATIRVAGDPTTAVDYALFGPINPGGMSPGLRAAVDAAYGQPLDGPDRTARFEDLGTFLQQEPQHLPLVQTPLVYLTTPDVLFADRMVPARLSSTLDVRVLARAAV